MTNYTKFKTVLTDFFEERGITFTIESSLHDASKNEPDQNTPPSFLYNGRNELEVISMDDIAKSGYKFVKGVPNDFKRNLNTVDAFLVDVNNEWYFIEFKDCAIGVKKYKDNIEKKGMANWLMLQDIFISIGIDGCEGLIDLNDLCKFAREHITYIVVCSEEKNSLAYDRIRDADKLGEKYTPECLYKFKDYFFKDAYAYTVDFFEQRFVKQFKYE